MNRLVACLLSLVAWTCLTAGELPAPLQAKFVKILAAGAGQGTQVACSAPALAGELAKAGVTVDPAAKLAWAATESEVRHLKSAGKVVICGRLEWLMEGASVAVVEEAGKPQLYLSMGNLSGTGITFSDTVLKIARRM